MSPFRIKSLQACLPTAVLIFLWVPASLWAAPVHIGVVIDGESWIGSELEAGINQELEVLAGDEMDIRFEPRHRVGADWTLDGADRAIRQLLEDPEVDLILTVGILSSQRVCCLGQLPKPVLATTILDARLQGLPRDGASSGVANLTYVELPDTTAGSLKAFYSVAPFRKVAFLVNREIARDLPELLDAARLEIEGLGLEVTFIEVSSLAQDALDGLDAMVDVDAVYVWPLYRFGPDEVQRLVDGLIFRGLPSFSAVGGREIEAGILASHRESNLFKRLSRRVALDIQRILLGEDAGTIPVELRGAPQLMINATTARALGLEPPWETLLEAMIIGNETPADEEILDLPTVMRRAIETNLDLRAQDRAVAAGAQEVQTARSAWRPQLSSSVAGILIDDDRAEASFGQQAERTLTAGLEVSQLLYDDGAAANVEIQKALQRAREASFDGLRLDIALEAGVTYLELLRAETLQRVQRNNLDLTRENLSLAELRVEVGAANPAEVFRWQSQIASDRQNLVSAAAGVEQARLGLNRVLNRPLEQPFSTVAVGLQSDFLIDPESIRGFIATPTRFRIARDFNVLEGLRRSPDLVGLEAALEAQERRLKAARRAFRLPSFAAQASLDHLLEAAGAGSDVTGLGPSADDTNWSLALSGSYNLLTGGARRAEQIQAEEEIARIRLDIEAASEAIAQGIRSAMVQTRASYLSIELAQQAADAAKRSQELVADSYARGAVSILDLLDAQNATLNAELAAANAVYDFFIDLLRVERATNSFYTLEAPTERDDWLRRLGEYFTEKGLGPWSPPPFESRKEEP